MEPLPTAVPSGSAAIEARDLVKRYGDSVALAGCSLAIPRGQFVSLLGPSGCGKTTLLRVIGGFLQQDGGTVALGGETVDGRPPNKRAVNTVFQSYALFPHKSVADNIAFPLEIAKVGKAERRERVAEALELVRLPDVGGRAPTELSGGQAQRVALARALVSRPEVLLLDEPLAALDLKLRKAMQLELRRIHDELGTTFLYVTHDQEEALTMSDRIVLMNEGRIVQDGAPREVYDNPASTFASGFIGEANLLRGTVVGAPDGGTAVAVGELEMVGRSSDLAAGAEAVVSVRPESVVVAPPAAGGCANRFHGTVVQTIFVGPLVRARVELAPGISLDVAAARDAAAPLVDGNRVEVGFDAADVVVLAA